MINRTYKNYNNFNSPTKIEELQIPSSISINKVSNLPKFENIDSDSMQTNSRKFTNQKENQNPNNNFQFQLNILNKEYTPCYISNKFNEIKKFSENKHFKNFNYTENVHKFTKEKSFYTN